MKRIGIIGGGQISRMMILDGKRMDRRFLILDSNADCPAHSISDRHIVADFNDFDAVRHLSAMVDVVTYEPEHICTDMLQKEALESMVYPSADTLSLIQEEQKLLLRERKQETSVSMDVQKEIFVCACRNIAGEVRIYPAAEVSYKDGSWDEVIVPAELKESSAQEAESLVKEYLEKFHICGILGVRMSVAESGDLIVREIIPGPHELGNFTVDGCLTSQYENHIRAILGYSLGNTDLIRPSAVKKIVYYQENELGIAGLEEVYALPDVKIHIHEKPAADAGKGIGYVACMAQMQEEACESVRKAHDYIQKV